MDRWLPKIALLVVSMCCISMYMSTQVPITSTILWQAFGLSCITVGVVESFRSVMRYIGSFTFLNSVFAASIAISITSLLFETSSSLLGHITLPLHISALLRMTFISIFSIVAYNLMAMTYVSQKTTSSSHRYVLDTTALEDGRILDLARTGLFDGQICIPAFMPKELALLIETGDEIEQISARKSLDTLKRLELLPRVALHYVDVRSPSQASLQDKIWYAAKNLGCSIITSESSPMIHTQETIGNLAIDSIANALRPPIPKGEVLAIKVQRLGKEPKQGIGYLEDGTMVVVNGGGDFLGKTIRTHVLSQKYSSSGKIVFCNVREEENAYIE